MKLTILICTRNGAATIGDALKCVRCQTDVSADDFEVIVVDNGSTDITTWQVRQGLERLACRTSLLAESKEGKINAIMRGINAARAPLISIVDDDNMVCQNFVRRTIDMFEMFPELGIVGSVNSLDAAEQPPWFAMVASLYGCAAPGLYGTVRRIDAYRTIASKGIIAGAGSTFRVRPLQVALENGFTFLNDTFRRATMVMNSGEDTELCLLYQHYKWWFGVDTRITLKHRIRLDRLSWHYAVRLCRSAGAGGAAVQVYIALAHGALFTLKGSWWWMSAQRLRRLSKLVPRLACATLRGRTIDPRRIEFESELGALLRLIKERGAFTRSARNMAARGWTSQTIAFCEGNRGGGLEIARL